MNAVRVPLASSLGVRSLNSWRAIVVQTALLVPLVARLSVKRGTYEVRSAGAMFVAICTSITQFESAFS